MDEKLGSLIIDLHGHVVTPEERELLAHPHASGVILFSRNFAEKNQLKDLCKEIRAARKNPLLIMVDQEGGRVQRFKETFTRLPAAATFGKLYRHSATKALSVAKECAWLMAAELLACGVDLSLAPVLDLDKQMNPAIGDRAFSNDSSIVIALTQAFIAGMQEAGMAAVGKHFPGHGSVAIDSHIALPTDTRDFEQIKQADLQPFIVAINNNIAGIMSSHIVFPAIDAQPVSYSSVWLQEILRQQLNFNGIIFSDDLNMQGANISANYAERFCAAKKAGCELILLCNNRAGVIEVLDKVAYAPYQLSESKWRKLQGDFHLNKQPLTEYPRWHKTRECLLNNET